MNTTFTHKKYLSIALVIGLLFMLPVAIFMSQNQQETRSRATGPTPTDISDDFSGTSLDTNKWITYSNNSGINIANAVKQEGGVLRSTIPSGITSYTGVSADYKQAITGDFIATADATIEQGGDPFGSDTFLLMHDDSWNNGMGLSIRKGTGGTFSLVAYRKENSQQSDVANVSVPNAGPITLQLQRTGSNVAYSYKIGNGSFTQIAAISNIYTGDGRLSLTVNTWEPNFPSVTSSFDNFSASVNLAAVPTLSPTPVATCITLPTNDTFDPATQLPAGFWTVWKSTSADVTQPNGTVQATVPGGQTGHAGLMTLNTVCGDFDVSVNFSQFSAGGQTEGDLILRAQDYSTDAGWSTGSDVLVQRYAKINDNGFWTGGRISGVNYTGYGANVTSTSGKLRIRRIGNVFTTYYNDGSDSVWHLLATYTKSLSTSLYITFGVSNWDQNPSISGNFDNFSLTQAVPDPSLTPLPPTPTLSPVPTPPSGADKFTIDPGVKQSLAINIGASINPQIRFKSKLGSVRSTPDLYFRLRVRDEALAINNPTQSVTDACTNPPPSDHDFYIPMKSTGGVYSPVSQNSSTVPGAPGATVASVSADGWVSLDGIVPGRYYTLYLKGPMTRKSRMVQHILLQPNQISAQDFDWSAITLDPGDLPDPNNSSKQDCVINATDWSLLQSRIGSNDASSLSVCDVNYDGICNAGDSVAILNTLSTRPDDDQ